MIVQQPAAKGTHDVSFKELIATAACRSCVHGYGDPIYIYTLPTGQISVSGFPSMIATREGCAKSTCQLPDLSYSSRSQKDIETKSMDNGHFSVF